MDEHVAFMKKALSRIKTSQHAISTTVPDIRGDEVRARTHCSCPMVLDFGNSKAHLFFQGSWYRDRLVRTPQGWKLKERIEEGYWNYNVPPGFQY